MRGKRLLQSPDEFLEGPQRSYRPARGCARDEFFNGCPEWYSIDACRLAKRIHCRLANSARGNIQYAEQRDVVLRMHCQAHVSQRIFHFGAIVEAEAAHQLVTQAAAPENLFECARLEIRAVLYSTGQVRIVIQNALELTGYKLRFGLRIPRLKIPQISRVAFLRAQGLTQSFRIVGDDSSGRVENVLLRALGAFQLDDPGGREIARKTQEDGDIGATPAVDGLIFVADNTNVLLRTGQQPHQLVLHSIRVLISVHMHELEPGLPLLTRRRGFAQ